MGTTSTLSEMSLSLIDDVSTIVTSLPLDVTLIAVVVILFFSYSLWSGKSRGTALLLSAYISGFILSIFPYWGTLTGEGATDPSIVKLIVFGVMFVVLHIVLKAVIFANFSSSLLFKWAEAFFLGIATTTLLLFYIERIILADSIYSFSPEVASILSSQVWFFWALTLPIIGLYFMNRDEF